MKNNISKFFSFLFIILLCAFFLKIYAPWLLSPVISGGDWPYYSKSMLDGFAKVLPQLWTGQGGIGLGGVNTEFPIFSYLSFTGGFFTTTLHIPWMIVSKITWFGLFLVLSIVSSIRLYKVLKPQANRLEYILSSFIYIANSYILMIVGGGQMGIALAYAVTPLVISQFLKIEDNLEKLSGKQLVRSSVLTGLIIALQIFFEPRITYLTFFVLFIYFLYTVILTKKFFLGKHLVVIGIVFLVVILLHLYWIAPFFLFHLLSVPTGITSQSGFIFFSFADFSSAFAFLHPNWPSNIFGKVSFLRPEFLLYPIASFSGLLFLKKVNKYYLFFALILLISVFMAKGTNPPFGMVNTWIFSHILGMNIFRDPTKFYFFIALPFSILIPFSLSKILEVFEKHNLIKIFVITIFLFIIVFPVRDAILGKLSGTFQYVAIPKEYQNLENFLSMQYAYFRTLWVPDQSRFRYISETHPMLIADSTFQTTNLNKIPQALEKFQTAKELDRLSVKYIIVPDDTQSEIFLTDRKYDDSKRISFIKKLDAISGLKKITLGNIVLYENPSYFGHFFTEKGLPIASQSISSQQYDLNLNVTKEQKIIFSEAYNPGWEVIARNQVIKSIKTQDGLNSFTLPQGTVKASVIFAPSEFEWIYESISVFNLLALVLFVVILKE